MLLRVLSNKKVLQSPSVRHPLSGVGPGASQSKDRFAQGHISPNATDLLSFYRVEVGLSMPAFHFSCFIFTYLAKIFNFSRSTNTLPLVWCERGPFPLKHQARLLPVATLRIKLEHFK